jgi:hypothetical protein
MEKVKIAREFLSKKILEGLAISPTNTLDTNSFSSLEYFGNFDVKFFIAIADSFTDELDNHLKKLQSENTSGVNLEALVVITDSIEDDLRKTLHTRNIGVIHYYGIEKDKFEDFRCADLVRKYILFLKQKKPTYSEIITKFEELLETQPDHGDHEGSSFLFRYVNLNQVKPYLADKEADWVYWEALLITCQMRTEIGFREEIKESEEKDSSVFTPLFTTKNEDGTTYSHPDLNEMNNDDVKAYYSLRLQKTQTIPLKVRYLEFLIEYNFVGLSRPMCYRDLIENLMLHSEWILKNKKNIKFYEIDHTKSLHRMIEVLSKYFTAFDQEFRETVYTYYMSKFEQYRVEKSYRWMLDLIRILLLYKNIKEFLDLNISLFVKVAEEGFAYFKQQNNVSLSESYIEIIADLQKSLNAKYDKYWNLGELYETEAKRFSSSGGNSVACHFIEMALSAFEKSSTKDENRIKELKKLYSDTALKAKDELKKIEAKIPIDEKVFQERDLYVQRLSELPDAEAKLNYFFGDSSLLLSESFFQKLFEQSQSGLAGLMPLTIVDERGTVAKATNKEEEREIREFSIYGTSSILYLDKIAYIFDKGVERSIFVKDEMVAGLKGIGVEPKRISVVEESLELFFKGHYLASSSILIPLIENYFRSLRQPNKDDIKFKKSGVEYNVSLDAMILDSQEAGMPLSVIRFARFLLTHKAGLNLRNKFFHGFIDFEKANLRIYATWILWLSFFLALSIREES